MALPFRAIFSTVKPPRNFNFSRDDRCRLDGSARRARRLSIVKNIFHVFRIGDREDNFYHYRS